MCKIPFSPKGYRFVRKNMFGGNIENKSQEDAVEISKVC